MSAKIDLTYRPRTYFRPQMLEKHLLGRIKGEVVRQNLKALFAEGRHGEVASLAQDLAMSDDDRKELEAVHPMFMGGNYLPTTRTNEVEIARISIESTTYDVTCVYARLLRGRIHYRIVDEYEGQTLRKPRTKTSPHPLSLGELTDFFLKGWPFLDVLEYNFDDDLEGALGFFTADSDFYPQFEDLCVERATERFRASKESGT